MSRRDGRLDLQRRPAFAVAELEGLGPALVVGLVLLGASPGGTTANLLTHLARGDTAL